MCILPYSITLQEVLHSTPSKWETDLINEHKQWSTLQLSISVNHFVRCADREHKSAGISTIV